jgi:diamine N-acetyltransferase
MNHSIRLRPLEREDLRSVHLRNNNAAIMRYWFEEPYETFDELTALYDAHVHDQTERRFIVEHQNDRAGLVELVEIDLIHRRAEFQIIIAPEQQGRGIAGQATRLALDYGFKTLNLHKIFLHVDQENEKAIHIYARIGFVQEGVLIDEFFANGQYRNAIRMYLLQNDYLQAQAGVGT